MTAQRKGYFKLFSLNNITFFIHWTFPLGGIFVASCANFNLRNAIYYTIAYTSLIILHELGHAMVSVLLGYKVSAIQVSGFGGRCYIQRPTSLKHGFIVYSAGLLVQCIVFLIAIAYSMLIGMPDTDFMKSVFNTYTIVNAILIIINIIPYKHSDSLDTDGLVLWKLLRRVFQKGPLPFILPINTTHAFPPETRLIDIKGFLPKNFKSGIELLNDNTTPMDFVVNILTKYLQLSQDKAINAMVEIHQYGGKIISIPDLEKAKQIASNITSDAKEQGHSFVCRAIDTDS